MALPREKRFIIAPLNDHVFVNSLNLAMDPMIFMTVLFDQAPAEKIWSCRRDERGFLLQCKHLRDKTAIRWQLRDGQRRTVEIFTGKRNLLIALNDFQAQIENAGKVFRLVPPNRYRVERHGAEASTKMKHDLSWARFKANLERSKRDRINNKQVLEPVVLETELTE
jgi:hypothetical protein